MPFTNYPVIILIYLLNYTWKGVRNTGINYLTKPKLNVTPNQLPLTPNAYIHLVKEKQQKSYNRDALEWRALFLMKSRFPSSTLSYIR